jgi:hypothetical protein
VMNHPEAWRAMRLGNSRHLIETSPRFPAFAPG